MTFKGHYALVSNLMYMYHGVVTYLYSFTFNLLLGRDWLQQIFNCTLARSVL